MPPKQPPPWERLNDPVRAILGAVLVADMKWITGCRSNRDLERRIDGARLKKTSSGAYRYTDRYSRYERGVDLPGYETIERGKAATKHPELFRAIEHLQLWHHLAPTAAGHGLPFDTFNSLSEAARRIVYTKRVLRDGQPKRRRRSDRSMYEELLCLNNVDALTALAAFGHELSLDSRRNSFSLGSIGKGFSSDDSQFIKRITAGWVEMFVRLMIFTPFFEAHERILNYLSGCMTFPICTPFCHIRFDIHDTKKFIADARKLLNFSGNVRLIGSTIHEQMQLVYEYQATQHRLEIMDEISQIDYELRKTGKPTRLSASSPFYTLLRQIEHKAVRSGGPIILPRKPAMGGEFELTNALGPVSCESTKRIEPKTTGGTGGDQGRFSGSGSRFRRSTAAGKAVKSNQRMQLRKPARMTSETGED